MLAAALMLILAAARADNVKGLRFEIVTADESALTRHIADDLRQQLTQSLGAARAARWRRRPMLYVAVGPAALRELATRRCDCAVISAFTSSQVFHAIHASMPAGRAASMSAVYAEPAPADQLRLVSLLYPRPVHVAVILGRDTMFLRPVLVGQVDVQQLAPGEDINRVLNRIAPTEVLLAMPDCEVYNPDSIRNILLSTYRRKQALIGFSADMVKAGALATTYSEVEDIDAQVAEMVAAFAATGQLPPPQFPRYFHTIVNEGVARSLDLAVDDSVRQFARPAPHRP
jgi:hypothetical protein